MDTYIHLPNNNNNKLIHVLQQTHNMFYAQCDSVHRAQKLVFKPGTLLTLPNNKKTHG